MVFFVTWTRSKPPPLKCDICHKKMFFFEGFPKAHRTLPCPVHFSPWGPPFGQFSVAITDVSKMQLIYHHELSKLGDNSPLEVMFNIFICKFSKFIIIIFHLLVKCLFVEHFVHVVGVWM